MGDYADMVLKGLMCQGCGEYIGDDQGNGLGFPTWCPACNKQNKEAAFNDLASAEFACSNCNRSFKDEVSLDQHYRDKHGMPCDVCGKGKFKSQRALNDHKKAKHTGEVL